MKHFMVELTYTVPLERVDEVVGAHRAFLQAGYDQGLLLYSGGQVPRTGGIMLARAESQAALEAFLADDPYRQAAVAEYRIVEFVPVKHQDFLKDWVAGQ
ncbi:MAG TPA: YciI family protein [Chloroflexia bacterium]|nr:YciI family protein [Chloroflexia bacterium]